VSSERTNCLVSCLATFCLFSKQNVCLLRSTQFFGKQKEKNSKFSIMTFSYSYFFQGKNCVGNLSPAMGRGNASRNRVWNGVAKLHRLAGRYDNPMPTWFLAPIAGLTSKLPTLKRGGSRKCEKIRSRKEGG
jgi:hypothetical protein